MARTILLALIAVVAALVLATTITEANRVQLVSGGVLLVALVWLLMASSFSGDGGDDDAGRPQRTKRPSGGDPDDPLTRL